MKSEKGTLCKGTRVTLKRIFDAGQIYVSRVEIMGEKLIHEISGGQPYGSAYNQAEQLAVTIDAEFVVDYKVVRTSLGGEYFKSKAEEKK